jgi:hypothetical protein
MMVPKRWLEIERFILWFTFGATLFHIWTS